jgi:phage terminase large subunit GpA-like protein
VSDFASVASIRRSAMVAGLRPPPRLSLSEWADEHFRLSPESAAQAGRWTTLPYQRGIMDAITDPAVTQVSVMKSARVGYTLMFSAAIGYYMHQAPCPMLLVQPTVEDARQFSKETVAPMLRDVPVLSGIVTEEGEDAGPRGGSNTILHKRFPGGVFSLVGANSGAGFRRVSRKVVVFDEVDAYPPSAGSDGDPIKLGTRRTEAYWDRKIIAGSTPLVAGASRIESLYEDGDQRRFFVPCPSCGHMAPFVFSGEDGHTMKWPEGKPREAFFSCQANGCVIEHHEKRRMVEAGEWRALKPFDGHASFHIWAAYSYSANASWGQIAEEFVKAKDNPQTLRTFVNTVLGETFKERGEAPEWERLYQRREPYGMGKVPAGPRFLTAGVDVQKDRFVYEVVGWGAGKESWSIDAGVLPADTSNEADWARLDELLDRSYPTAAGTELPVRMLAVDSGFKTTQAYAWTRRRVGRAIAVKGVGHMRTLLGTPKAVDVRMDGRRSRGAKLWPVGSGIAKDELYGWLKLPMPEPGQPFPPGYCHFPELEPEYFKQLTAEHLVQSTDGRGFVHYEWRVIPGRENHFLDCRVYARAAAVLLGLDRMRTAKRAPDPSNPPVLSAALQMIAENPAYDAPVPPAPAPPPREARQEAARPPSKPPRQKPSRGGGFLRRGKGWLK